MTQTNTTNTVKLETTTLRNGQVALAKTSKFGTFAKTFANLTQANKAVEKLATSGVKSFVTARWPFNVIIAE
jgi:hypothetical protein